MRRCGYWPSSRALLTAPAAPAPRWAACQARACISQPPHAYAQALLTQCACASVRAPRVARGRGGVGWQTQSGASHARGQSLTVTPMFLAVPSMIFIAASTVIAFKSGSLISAIS